MAFYVRKESAVEDTIQTPDNVGNDLEQIKKNICGDSECEEEEYETVACNAADDIAEAIPSDSEITESVYQAIYESEYNMNQIIECIDMNSLKTESMGKTLMLEAADKKGFWESIKKFGKWALRKLQEFYDKYIRKYVSYVLNNNLFLKHNEEYIRNGFKKIGLLNMEKEEVIKFNLNELEKVENRIKAFSGKGKDDLLNDIDFKKVYTSSSDFDNRATELKVNLAKMIIPSINEKKIDVESIRTEIVAAVTEKVDDIRDCFDRPDQVIQILRNASKSDLDDVFNKATKSLNDLIKTADKNSKSGDDEIAATGYKMLAESLKYFNQILLASIHEVTFLRTKVISQARKFANLCVKASGSIQKESYDVTDNSRISNAFSSIKLI